MVTWTPKHPTGISTHWKGPPQDATFEESNLLVYSTEIKQERIINLETVYRYMHHWMKEEGWSSVHSGGNPSWYEEFYGVTKNQSGQKEIRWWWRAQKQHAGIADSHQYFRFKWFIDVLCTNMKQIEIMYKGKKIKPYMGEFNLWFNAVLELDINNWFVKGTSFALGEVLSDFFIRMIYKDKVRDQEIELSGTSERFISDLKYYLGLNRVDNVRQPLDQEKQWF
jgi:hypothetical protein